MKYLSIIFLLMLSFIGNTYASDAAPAMSDPTWLAESRASIKAGKYDQSIKQLQAANDTSSADWNNLMGYSLRQKSIIKPH